MLIAEYVIAADRLPIEKCRRMPLSRAALAEATGSSWAARCGSQTLVAAKDHPAGAGLQHAGHGDADLLVDVVAAPFDDDHRAVVEIADSLARLFAGLDDANFNVLAREKGRLEGVGQFVEIDHAHAVQPGDLVQVVVVRHDFAVQMLGQQHEFDVDRLAGEFGQLVVVDLQIDGRIGTQAVENVEASNT